MFSVATAMCWMPSAAIFLQVLLDLALVVGGLVDGNADAAARAGQRARVQAGQLAFDVEEADLAEVEQLDVEVEPLVHVAAIDVVGEVIEVVEADALWPRVGLAQPVELAIIGRAHRAVAVDEVDQRPADALDGRHLQRDVGTGVGLGAVTHRVFEGVLGVHDAPCHRCRTRPMRRSKTTGEGLRLGVEDVVDVALAVDRDVPGLVLGDGA
jgi:hypothetical protein